MRVKMRVKVCICILDPGTNDGRTTGDPPVARAAREETSIDCYLLQYYLNELQAAVVEELYHHPQEQSTK